MNQVSGVTPLGSIIDPLCMNDTDQCIQCSPNGPDKWPDCWELFLPKQFEKTIPVTSVTAEMTGHTRLIKEKSTRGRDRFPQWPWYDKFHAVDDHSSVIAVVTKLDGSPVDLRSIQSPTISSGKFAIPFPDSFLERSIHQRVAFIDPDKYRALKKKYKKDGVDVSKGFAELNRILEDNATFTSTMLCLNDASIFDQEKNYHGFFRVFGGRSAPTIDDTFTKISHPEWNVNVSYKVCKANYLPLGYPALYSCLFDPRFHRRHIRASDVDVIKRAVGSQGTYPS